MKPTINDLPSLALAGVAAYLSFRDVARMHRASRALAAGVPLDAIQRAPLHYAWAMQRSNARVLLRVLREFRHGDAHPFLRQPADEEAKGKQLDNYQHALRIAAAALDVPLVRVLLGEEEEEGCGHLYLPRDALAREEARRTAPVLHALRSPHAAARPDDAKAVVRLLIERVCPSFWEVPVGVGSAAWTALCAAVSGWDDAPRVFAAHGRLGWLTTATVYVMWGGESAEPLAALFNANRDADGEVSQPPTHAVAAWLSWSVLARDERTFSVLLREFRARLAALPSPVP
ncbi:hypothetical protein H9P43_009555 [Blastocladiella emersonii ATCC 22665]|nr:hypothetical protein H9P43_009555 [Blastocladiella emersonii ATCC 22665]